ncbi:16829_t:CDS:2, partial [Cetraspora pellucida]
MPVPKAQYKAAKYTNIFVAKCDNFKEQSLKWHLDTKDHQKTLKTQSVAQLNIVISFTKQFEIDKLPTHSITNLCSLIDQQLQNTQEFHISSNINVLKNPLALQAIELTRSDYSSYTNNHTRKDFIEVIGKVIEEKICHEIHKSSVWSLMINESNTVTKEKTLAIVSKHIVSNIPVNQFVGLIELKNCSTNGIIEELNKFFKVKNLPILTLGHFGSDGASVMLGCLNDIATQLKSQSLFLTEHHCILHCLALAYEDAAERIPYIYTYNKLLSLSNVVSNLHHILDSVVGALYLDSNTDK